MDDGPSAPAERYFRLHGNPDAPCFCPAHAYSGLWGNEWHPDGDRNRCRFCDGGAALQWQDCQACGGHGEHFDDDPAEPCRACDGEGGSLTCEVCDGDGWEPAVRGYSCLDTAQALVEYFHGRYQPTDDEQVIVFTGVRVGGGFDGEPLVVPDVDGVVETLTWAELVRRVETGSERQRAGAQDGNAHGPNPRHHVSGTAPSDRPSGGRMR